MHVRGRLVQSVITGKDDAVQTTSQLGTDKWVAMWQPAQVGMVVIKAPEVPKIDL
jgi:hypothetical protein